MADLRFAVLGCGFWSGYQIAGWNEVGGVRLVAVYNRTRAKAEAVAKRFGVPAVYDDAGRLLDQEKLDFVDVITGVDTHERFTALAAARRLAVVCQKPMAPDLETAERMAAACVAAKVPLLINENWRWQRPLRKFKELMESSGIGRPFRGRIAYSCSFPVFDNQPFLKDLARFILADMGSHILDVARFLFGEARSLYCLTRRVNPEIKGEDVATVMIETAGGAAVTCEISYASRLERERFPETYVLAECEKGSIELGPGFEIRVTDRTGTRPHRETPPRYEWADPAYAVVHASIVDCQRDLLRALRGEGRAETDASENIKTVRLVFSAYESARTGEIVRFAG